MQKTQYEVPKQLGFPPYNEAVAHDEVDRGKPLWLMDPVPAAPWSYWQPTVRHCFPGSSQGTLKSSVKTSASTLQPSHLLQKKRHLGTSLVIQSLRFSAPNAGAQVQSLIRELDRSHRPQLRPAMSKYINTYLKKNRTYEKKRHLCRAKQQSHCHWDQNLNWHMPVSSLFRKESWAVGGGNTTGVDPVVSQPCGRILRRAARNLFLFLFSKLQVCYLVFFLVHLSSLDAESVWLFLLQETTHFNGIRQMATYLAIDKDLTKQLIYQTAILILLFF